MVLKRKASEKQAGVLKKLKAEKNHDVLDDKGDIKRPNRRGVPEKVARWMSLNAKYVTNRLANHVMVDGQNLQETITSVIESLPSGKKIGSKQSEKIILQFSKLPRRRTLSRPLAKTRRRSTRRRAISKASAVQPAWRCIFWMRLLIS
jgi:hypothetical protein